MNSDNRSPFKRIIGTQYFIYFGVLGMFLPYFNLYCYHLGFSGFQIGVLSALRSLVMVISPLFWGILSDRLGMRRPIYIICNFASATIWVFYLFTANYWGMLAITLFYGIFYAPIISFLEAFTMDVLTGEKKSYGKLRVWGSLSFIITVIVLGKAIDLTSATIILPLILIGSSLLAVLSLKIPHIRSEKKTSFSHATDALKSRHVIVFLFCAFLMLVSHGAYYGFFSIHLENLGYDGFFIGMTWALASTSEILVMVRSDRLFKRFSLERVLLFSFGIAAIRWLLLFFVAAPALILLTQIMHAVTYGTFHMASILYIDRLTTAENKTLGQAVNNALTYGLGLMVGFFLNGWLYGLIGSHPLFLISSAIALTGGIIFGAYNKWGMR
jgi:PPP family 3-phenylpropionic acid transporter